VVRIETDLASSGLQHACKCMSRAGGVLKKKTIFILPNYYHGNMRRNYSRLRRYG